MVSLKARRHCWRKSSARTRFCSRRNSTPIRSPSTYEVAKLFVPSVIHPIAGERAIVVEPKVRLEGRRSLHNTPYRTLKSCIPYHPRRDSPESARQANSPAQKYCFPAANLRRFLVSRQKRAAGSLLFVFAPACRTFFTLYGCTVCLTEAEVPAMLESP